MANDTLAEIISAVRKRPYGGRGDIYRMLRANYRELVACLGEGEPSWRVIAEAMERTGVVGREGNSPTRKSLPRVWQRVCRDVAAQEALRLTGVKPATSTRRSKAPAAWRPSGFPQPNAPLPSGREHQGSHPAALPAVPQQRPALPPTSGATQDSSRPAPGSGAALREEMNQRSGRKANGEPKY